MAVATSTALMIAVGATMAGTALTAKSQQNQAKTAEKQGELDLIASQSATKQAEQDANEETRMELANKRREFLRTQGSIVAQQANTGVAGVTAERQRRNVDFQHNMDVQNIKKKSENTLISIRHQGFRNDSQIQSNLNRIHKPSGGEVLGKTALAGLSVYASGKSAGKSAGGKK